MQITIPFHLSDAELITELTRLASEERGAVAKLIAHLVVLDARGSHLALGYSSLFAYCREALHLSEHEAYNRIDVPAAIRKLPAPRTQSAVPAAIPAQQAPGAAPALKGPLPLADPSPRVTPPAAGRRSGVAPLSPDRYEVRFIASAATCDKLCLAQDLLRHAVPDGNTAEIVDRALTVLIEQTARTRFALVRRPRQVAASPESSRAPTADVKRTVYVRDGGRCAFVAAGGRRCNSRAFLEFHHVKPYEVGGEATVGNIQLRCRAHNQYEADVYFGPIREALAGVEAVAARLSV